MKDEKKFRCVACFETYPEEDTSYIDTGTTPNICLCKNCKENLKDGAFIYLIGTSQISDTDKDISINGNNAILSSVLYKMLFSECSTPRNLDKDLERGFLIVSSDTIDKIDDIMKEILYKNEFSKN